MVLPEFLSEVAFGEIRVTGSRVGLYHIVQCYRDGMSLQQLAEEYPTLSGELINKVVDFYLKNKQEVDDYMSRCDLLSEEQRRSAFQPDWDEMRKRISSEAHQFAS